MLSFEFNRFRMNDLKIVQHFYYKSVNNSLKKHSYIIQTQVQKNNSKNIQIPLLRRNRLSSQLYDIPPFKNRSQNKFNAFFTQFQPSETLSTEKTRWL